MERFAAIVNDVIVKSKKPPNEPANQSSLGHHGTEQSTTSSRYPLQPEILVSWGILLTPVGGVLLMSASTAVVVINDQLLKRIRL